MAQFRIMYYVVKPLANGGYGHYFEPSPALKAKGWRPLNLGASPQREDHAKQELARAKIAEVEAWRNGGAKPREVKRFAPRHTIPELIDLYLEDEKFTALKPNTQRTNRGRLAAIRIWGEDRAGKGIAVASIGPDNVTVLRKALMKPDAAGAVHHHRAHGILSMLRTLLGFAEDRKIIPAGSNPARDFNLAAPPPRDEIWEPHHVAAFGVAAAAIGYPDLLLAVEVAEYIGQREADLLKLRALPPPSKTSNWREIHNLDAGDRAVLAGADGRVMGLQVRQEKTNRWVGAPIAGDLRRKIEARIAENAARAVPHATLLVDDKTGLPWKVRQFQRMFDKARSWAIAPPADARADGVEPCPDLEGLQYRDLRRTCVVRLGELNMEDSVISAISGHQLNTTKKILETYMPRTTKAAARGVVARIRAAGVVERIEEEREKQA